MTPALCAAIFGESTSVMSPKLAFQIGLSLVTAVALVGAVFLLVNEATSSPGVEILLPEATPSVAADIEIYGTDAVENPGVYTLREGNRLEQAIEAAGGATSDADLAAVNLAARVLDEDPWQIPKAGEEQIGQVTEGRGTSARIDVNTANVETLKTLPQSGDVKAQSIVAYRESHGPFSDVEALVAVNGIGPATVEAIKTLVVAR